MRFIPEFMAAASLILLALLSFSYNGKSNWTNAQKALVLFISLCAMVSALLFRGFSGKGLDDVAASALRDVVCRYELSSLCRSAVEEQRLNEFRKRQQHLQDLVREQERQRRELRSRLEAARAFDELTKLKSEIDALKSQGK